jgi:hypothetical protein
MLSMWLMSSPREVNRSQFLSERAADIVRDHGVLAG